MKNYNNDYFSNCVKELEAMYALVNEKIFAAKAKKINLPVFVTIASQGKRSCYGWCGVVPFWDDGKECQKYEINISSETLGRDVGDTFVTLVHEMVHLYHVQVDVKDASLNSGRHNKNFKAGCDKVGLRCEDSGTRIGYATHFPVTESSKELQDVLAEYVANNHADYLAINRTADVKTKKRVVKRGQNSFKLFCPCCGVSCRATNEAISIKCADCDEILIRK